MEKAELTKAALFALKHPIKGYVAMRNGFNYIRYIRDQKAVANFSARDVSLLIGPDEKIFIEEVSKYKASVLKITENIISPADFRLAGAQISSGTPISWKDEFQDQEDFFALHRFIWLKNWFVGQEGADQFVIHALVDWITENHIPKSPQVWESYSVAERIASWVHIVIRIEWVDQKEFDVFREIVKLSIRYQLDYLSKNLELRGPHTNNHILNDAKGLYIGGAWIDDENFMAIGRDLFFKWAPKIIRADGALKENSSHYQLLIYDRVKEVLTWAEKREKDSEFYRFIYELTDTTRTKSARWCVIDQNDNLTLPLVGDVSPDMTPQYLLQSNQKALFSFLPGKREKDSEAPKITHDFCEIDGNWYRCQIDDVVLFVNGGRGAGPLKHGHYDFGSFVLLISGVPIIVDNGRASYLPCDRADKSVENHNSITVDGLGVRWQDHRLDEIKLYDEQNGYFEIEDKNNYIKATWSNDGMGRGVSDIVWKRIWRLTADSLEIHDAIQGKGPHVLKSFWHINPNLAAEIEDREIKINSGNNIITLKLDDRVVEGSQAGPDKWEARDEFYYSESYGDKIPANSFMLKATWRDMAALSCKVRW